MDRSPTPTVQADRWKFKYLDITSKHSNKWFTQTTSSLDIQTDNLNIRQNVYVSRSQCKQPINSFKTPKEQADSLSARLTVYTPKQRDRLPSKLSRQPDRRSRHLDKQYRQTDWQSGSIDGI